MTTVAQAISRVRATLKAVKEDPFLTDRNIYFSIVKYGIYSGCYFKRTKDQLPQVFEGMFGPLLRTVSSIDSSIRMFRTEPVTYVSITRSTNYKYNNKIYFWYRDGYIYVGNADWDAIKVEGIFEGDKSDFLCPTPENQCRPKQDLALPFPEYLFSEIEQFVIKDLTTALQVPPNGPDDSQNALR